MYGRADHSTYKSCDSTNPEGTLTFKETRTSISVNWTADVGAAYYYVCIQRGNELYEKNTSAPSYEFKNSVYAWCRGEKFWITVKSVRKDEKEMSLLHFVAYVVGPNKTTIHDCTWRDGVVTFTWQPVTGAMKYVILIMDDLVKEELAPKKEIDVSEEGKGCEADVPMTEKFGIGTTCMTKVIVHHQNNLTSESDWKPHLIGGNKVPRNVKAARNEHSSQSKRSFQIAFDHPRQGPASKYKITAIPKSGGRLKTQQAEESPVVFKYLRIGVSYVFEVSALWKGGWSMPSLSNSMRTDGDENESPVIGFQNMEESRIDLTGSTLHGSTTKINFMGGDDFGKVRDMRYDITSRGENDFMTIYWKVPSFDNHLEDYKVEQYTIEIRRKNGAGKSGSRYYVQLIKDKLEYSSYEYKLELGNIYFVLVSTIYDDIDQDTNQISSAVNLEVVTRPCKPIVSYNDYKHNKLRIEWNATKGAQRYEVEIHTENSSPITKDMQKSTGLTMEFHEKFGYGTTYHAVIKAFGIDNKTNSCLTRKRTIGGKYVPTNMVATIDNSEVKDRNSQAFLSWNAPTLSPKSYLVSATPEVDDLKIDLNGLSCLVSGLKAGSFYYFEVKAVHVKKEDGKEICSGGCLSNRIQTNPTPTQVKNVWADLGENPSTSVEIHWEKEKEVTNYKVCVTNEDETTKLELTDVKVDKIILRDLEPGSTYFVTVAGGNSIAYGKDSDKFKFKTALGTPKNVNLANNKDNPSTSLILEFLNAEGQASKYVAALYKCRNQEEQAVLEAQEVESGHIYSDLEPNTKYLVKLRAVFVNGEGKSVKSKIMMTAPSKTKITEYGCTSENRSGEIYAKWNSDIGCSYHEIKVIRGRSTIECQLFIKNEKEFRRSCLNKSAQYSVQVRSRNDFSHFGGWSNEAVIYLAPAKLQQVSTELDEYGDNILVQCHAALAHSPFYFMRALCEKEPIGVPIQSHAENEVVKWKFTPPDSAQRYSFELWAEGLGRIKGETALSNPIISRPPKFTFATVRTFLSTDIEMAWEEQDRCDSYEIAIRACDRQMPENVVKTAKTSCWYRCKCPGNTYIISIRASRDHVKGIWSDDQQVTLDPAEIHLLEPTDAENKPVKRVKIEWKALEILPEGYLVNLFCNGKEVEKIKSKSTNHVFENNLEPGSLCYCTVAAFNDKDCKIIGKASKSKNLRIKWMTASNLIIVADVNEPYRRATISWDKPTGINCFKLEIENNQTGVVTTAFLADERHVFESGISGNTYSVRLHCGCDDCYDINYIQQGFTMKPAPPTDVRVIANEQVKGLTIEFRDMPSIGKQYEIIAQGLTDHTDRIRKITSQRCFTLHNLVPGESYKVFVSVIIGESKSIEATSEGYISTLPDRVRNLRSRMDEGIILFEWNELKIMPSKYIVEWRVDNEPITEEHTQEPSIRIYILKPARYYRVRVKAANSSGVGQMSVWENFKTGMLASPDGSQTQTKPSSTVKEIPREQSGKACSSGKFSQTKKIINTEKLELSEREDLDIWYDPNSPLRIDSNVFLVELKGAGGVEEVVLKIIPGITESNRREVKNLQMVTRHENIVKYYASGFCKFRGRDAIYLLMEKCDQDTVWERKRVAYPKCKFEIHSIGEGIRYIHERHIVHRDLKPHNILMRDGVLVISDFGLSKRLPEAKSNTSQSQPNVGTDGWRAPETGADDAKTTKASDIYSYGLVNYYMLTNGKHPYGDEPRHWHTWICHDNDGTRMCLDDLDSLPDAPLSKDLIKSMLERKPERRPTITDVLSHPFFWDDRRKFEFISDVCKYLELVAALKKKEAKTGKASAISCLSLDDSDGKYAQKVDMRGWKEKIILDETELQEFRNKAGVSDEEDVQEDSIQQKVKKKARDCVSDAIKFIRNRYTHNHEDKSENIDLTNEELWEFFYKRFPYLFLFVYHKMKLYFTEKSKQDKDFTDTVARYFER